MEDNVTLKNKYKLGEILGKGGWGTVYKAWDMESGNFVAVKQIGITHIPKDQIHGFMVLDGLVYLHGEGVIHRDIKGANILTTKSGQVKLTDFGVAVRGNTSNIEANPAGSPYWMAPEVIEMNGVSTKSDIWSLGCTIIELFTRDPPYYDCEPMAALFKIVQDDMPPLPEGISPLLRDFLIKCFQKEPFLRSSAEALLKHRWILSSIAKDTPKTQTQIPAEPRAAIEQYNKKIAAKLEGIRRNTLVNVDTSSLPFYATDEVNSSTAYGARPLSIQEIDINVVPPNATISTSLTSNTVLSDKVNSNEQYKEQESVDDDENWGDIEIPIPNFNSDLPTKSSALSSSSLDSLSNSGNVAARVSQINASLKPINTVLVSSPPRSSPGQATTVPDELNDIDDEKWDDIEVPQSQQTANELFANKLVIKMNSTWDATNGDHVEQDPFDMFDNESFELMNEDETITKDHVANVMNEVMRIMKNLTKMDDEPLILHQCELLTVLFREYPNEHGKIIAITGVIVFVDLLQMNNMKIIFATLRMVNMIIDDPTIRESFSVVGGIPVILQYASRKYTFAIRFEVSVFINKVLMSSQKATKAFISSGGLPVLVGLISFHDDYTDNRNLYLVALDCLCTMLNANLKIGLVKNDICRLFTKTGLLVHLAIALKLINKDPTIYDSFIDQIADVFLLFSKGDSIVKAHFCEQEVLKCLLHMLQELKPPIFLKILKSITAVSMSPDTLNALQNAGAIKILVPYMARREGQLIMESHQQLFTLLYNLCRLNGGRQLQAVKAGIIPHLRWVIEENHTLKQFALPILFEMARTKKTRAELFKPNGVNFFLKQFKQQYPWQVLAIDSISEWVVDDSRKASIILEQNADKFVEVFAAAKDESLLAMLEPLNKIILHSKLLNRALYSSSFIQILISRLNHHNALVQVNLLKLLTSFLEAQPKPSEGIVWTNLIDVVKSMEKDQKVLVAEMAKELVARFSKPAPHRKSEHVKETSISLLSRESFLKDRRLKDKDRKVDDKSEKRTWR